MESNALPVKSAVRTIELLEYFAGHLGQHSLGELQEVLGYPKSSLYVLLRTLVELGWVEVDPTGTRYGIGVRALLVGTSYIDGDEVVLATRDTMDWLATETTETVHLARLDGADVVYLATRASQHYLRPFTRVGRRLPAYATSLGKALLATRPEAEVRGLLPATLEPLTPHTITDPDALLADLAETRERGYAVDREENTLGLRCFGVALGAGSGGNGSGGNGSGGSRDALSCSVPVARLTPEREAAITATLLAARDRMAGAVRHLYRV
jgi:IclR family transcriptional regulator, acetate operon repressor